MFTTIDKALVAFIMSAIFLINYFFGTKIGVDPSAVALGVSALTPVLVYLIPNRRH